MLRLYQSFANTESPTRGLADHSNIKHREERLRAEGLEGLGGLAFFGKGHGLRERET